jgi:hypothetical protein
MEFEPPLRGIKRKSGQRESGDSRRLRVTPKAKIPSEKLTEERRIRIAELAYQLYEQRDREDGHDFDDWLEAERQVLEQPH